MSETTTHADFEKTNRANSCKSSFSFLDQKLSDRKMRKLLQRHKKTHKSMLWLVYWWEMFVQHFFFFGTREFKKRRRLAISLVFWDCSMLTTLYKIGQGHLILLGTNGFHVEAKNERFTAASLPFDQNLKWKFQSIIWETTSKTCTKKCAARTGRLFFLIQPIIW